MGSYFLSIVSCFLLRLFISCIGLALQAGRVHALPCVRDDGASRRHRRCCKIFILSLDACRMHQSIKNFVCRHFCLRLVVVRHFHHFLFMRSQMSIFARPPSRNGFDKAKLYQRHNIIVIHVGHLCAAHRLRILIGRTLNPWHRMCGPVTVCIGWCATDAIVERKHFDSNGNSIKLYIRTAYGEWVISSCRMHSHFDSHISGHGSSARPQNYMPNKIHVPLRVLSVWRLTYKTFTFVWIGEHGWVCAIGNVV